MEQSLAFSKISPTLKLNESMYHCIIEIKNKKRAPCMVRPDHLDTERFEIRTNTTGLQ